MKLKLLLGTFFCSLIGWCQVSMTTTGSYTQDFNSLTTAGTWVDNGTIANWYSQRTGAGTTWALGNGSSATGDLYSFGTPPIPGSDRALGTVGSNGVGNMAHGLLLQNNSGNPITNVMVSYTGEQWRSGNNVAQTVAFYYKISGALINNLNPGANGTWTAVPALDFVSLQNGVTTGALDGNLKVNKSVFSVTIPALSIPSGSYIMIKWDDPNHAGNDHGMAIDDVTVNWKTLCVNTTWDGATWSIPPTSSTNLIFNGNYSSSANLSGCSCTVNSGTVVFNSGHTLSIADGVDVLGGSLTFNNNAGLVQTYSVVNTGDITYVRDSSPIIYFDYTYWSSPTTGSQTLLNFSPNTLGDKFFTYHNSWIYAPPSSTTFTKGIGYAIRAPQTASPSIPTVFTHQFIGVPNNGNVDVAVALGPPVSNRLIGNPYPSTLDANAFINNNVVGTGNINQTISGTLYFWTHNHTLSGNNYLATDYATYNLTGGTAVSTGTGNTTAPTQFIAAGQGFFINTVANGNVSFRNFMRTATNTNNFYKSGQTVVMPEDKIEKHRIWLNLTNETSNFSQALIGYVQNATNDYNPGYDGLYFGSNQFVMYSLLNNEAYTIQARELPFSDADTVPLGFKTNVAGNLSMCLDHADGIFATNQKVFLEDVALHTIHDLKASPYTFYSDFGTFNNRFVLRFTNQNLNVVQFETPDASVDVFVSNQELRIHSKEYSIKSFVVYSILGQMLTSQEDVNRKEMILYNISQANQALIVKVILEEGQTVIKKILY